MACCTTISPLNSSQKRSGSVFDLPRTAKRRRAPGGNSTGYTTYLSASATNSVSIDAANSHNPFGNMKRPVIIEQEEKPTSVFSHVPYRFGSGNSESPSNSDNETIDNKDQFKTELSERIKCETKRLIKRKQITLSTTTNNIMSITPSDLNNNLPTTPVKSTTNTTPFITSSSSPNLLLSTKSVSESSSVKTKDTTTSSRLNQMLTNHNDLPLFSMNQVNLICERLLKEREQLIREEYDKILTEKLNEQYDAFVKFTHEQIQRRFDSSQFTYVS